MPTPWYHPRGSAPRPPGPPGPTGRPLAVSDRCGHRARAAGAWLADRANSVFDSWRFIVAQTAVAVVLAVFNRLAPEDRWVPGPLLGLALILGPQAAYAAPLVLLSQIRLADTARINAQPCSQA
ncbi:DUF1003 domain-containing protein [Streptomycetaceae bacterium NBC_01309]